MTDLDLAVLTGVSTGDVRQALWVPVQQDAVIFDRVPADRRWLALTATGAANLRLFDLEDEVLDLLATFGPRSMVDLSEDLNAGREIADVLGALAHGNWIVGFDPGVPDPDIAITARGSAGVAYGRCARSCLRMATA
jgi:hypothetical protein